MTGPEDAGAPSIGEADHAPPRGGTGDRGIAGEPSLPALVGLGLAAAALFSMTFVLNRAMSLSGGHWVWAAVLRYVFTIFMLSAWLLARRGPAFVRSTARAFRQRLGFWLVAGGTGYGVFYAAVCFATDHAPGWVVAATWQVTVVASPLVLLGFGLRVPARGLLAIVTIFAGVLAIHAGEIVRGISLEQGLLAVLPVLVAAIAYPVGNQLLNRARHENGRDRAVLADPAACVLLMSLGALPALVILVASMTPPPPNAEQIAGTFAVALVAGALATTLFTYARNLSTDPYRVSAVDATQAGEVAFALLAEVLLLGAPLPGAGGWVGLASVALGMIWLVRPAASKASRAGRTPYAARRSPQRQGGADPGPWLAIEVCPCGTEPAPPGLSHASAVSRDEEDMAPRRGDPEKGTPRCPPPP
jgi:drug/metabolite transporter (DMT)-like permease